ncbi:hypothetical protein KUV50_05770 [Membranicola marinus]|uniref:Uncharacterized protein n=1 Tax=Membranihabitans marinus TaxID=1227546 RepID=A0A953L9I1_9BACT|nr:hypothetical protein [Membranihabitans marinus]MBY5957628.1 hypothetical protein [Membranihabitans marinus]
MMYNKIIIAVFALFIGLTFSCEDEYVDTVEPSPVVGADVPGLAFSNENTTSFELDPAQNPSITLTVTRNNASGSVDAPVVVVENTENSFEVPSTVSFASGADTATLVIPVKEGAPTATPLTLKLKFEEAYVNPYTENYPVYVGELTLIKWDKYADGTYNSAFFETSWDQELLRQEGSNIYRLKDVFAPGVHYEFEWEEGAVEVTPLPGVQLSGYDHATYGPVTTTTSANPEATNYDAETSTFSFLRKWTVSAGSFGELVDTYVITELAE